jgi:hypothetical protein
MTIFNSAAEAEHSEGGFWLSKRRDGRSDHWMIARYHPRTRSVIYRSTKTGDVAKAQSALIAFSQEHACGDTPVAKRIPEWLYFIEAETGQIKIGIARDVDVRLAGLRTMSPVGLKLLVVVPGGHALERSYHVRFAAHRLHGEWFERHPDILAEIARLTLPGDTQ